MTSKDFLIPILQKMVSIPTENPVGETKEIVEYLYSIFPEEKGFRKEIITHTKNGVLLHNLVVKIGSGKEKIVMCGHLDTVPSGSKVNWNFDPFSGQIHEGKVYGRGSADMKGGVVSLIGVMFDLLEVPELLEKFTFVLAGTADEESGMSGAEKLEKSGIMNDAILLIVPEATNLHVGIAEKGVVWVKLKTIGKQAHGSMPEQGINAIEVASSLIPQLYKCLDPNVSSEILGKSTLNIGTISGGTKINVVPNEVTLELDYRLVPEENEKKVFEKLSGLQVPKGKYEIEFMNVLPALISKNSLFIDNLVKISGKKIGLTYGTDAAKLLQNKDIPFVIFGPGDDKIIHQDNEFVPIEEVVSVSEKIKEALITTYL